MKKIFINYRKALSFDQAQLLHELLAQYFKRSELFLDDQNIEGGSNWVSELEAQVRGSAVVLVLLPEGWVDATDERGSRRIDNPDDFVRFEIVTALQRGIEVIPLVVDNAALPKLQDLPQVLWPLLNIQYLDFRRTSYRDDAKTIADHIKRRRGPRQFSSRLTLGLVALALACGIFIGLNGIPSVQLRSISGSKTPDPLVLPGGEFDTGTLEDVMRELGQDPLQEHWARLPVPATGMSCKELTSWLRAKELGEAKQFLQTIRSRCGGLKPTSFDG